MEVKNDKKQQHFKIGEFEGPLDLLLFLIRKSEVSVYDIPIAEITEQYLKYLTYATRINLENITDFYLMAATLLHIKSQMLLPVEVDLEDDGDDPRQELVERLIEYQKFKKITDLISKQGEEAEWAVDRSSKQRILPFSDDDDLWEQIDVWDLLKSFSSMISNLSTERIIDLYEEVSINEKLTLIREFVDQRGEFLFQDLLINRSSVMEVVCAFLAVLESVKMRLLYVYQNRLFGDIRLRRREAVENLDPDSDSDELIENNPSEVGQEA